MRQEKLYDICSVAAVFVCLGYRRAEDDVNRLLVFAERVLEACASTAQEQLAHATQTEQTGQTEKTRNSITIICS